MKRDIRIRGVRRKQIDDDKLAIAFLMLARSLHEQRTGDDAGATEPPVGGADSEVSK